MGIRTIRTDDGSQFCGSSAEFSEPDDANYIEFKRPFVSTKIYKSKIIFDSNMQKTRWTLLINKLTRGFTKLFFVTVITGFSLKYVVEIKINFNLEQEIQKLFKQPYIDPLTKYIHKYQQDTSRTSYKKRVLAEREKRCAKIEQRYRNCKKNKVSFRKIKRDYKYSCPNVVARLAKKLAKYHYYCHRH